MDTAPDPNSLLAGGGGRYFKFDNPGDRISGELVGFRTEVETEYGTDTPKTWNDGKPRHMLVCQVKVDEREDAEDDGVRNVYLRGWPGGKTTGIGAVAEAVKKATGGHQLAEGATIAIAYTGNGEPSKPGFAPPKQFSAAYKPPAAGANLDDLLAS